MLRVTLTYMGTIRAVVTCDEVVVMSGGRIWTLTNNQPNDTGWTMDGYTSIVTEPAENA